MPYHRDVQKQRERVDPLTKVADARKLEERISAASANSRC